MRRDIVTSTLAVLILTVALGLGYPLLVTGVSQLAFPSQANGELIRVAGKVVGSKRIGQSFGGNPRYFQSRPSATTPADNPAATTFSNLGPNDSATEKEIAANIQAYLKLEGPFMAGLQASDVPVDAADTSASGIDPDISLANARIQAHRVAAVRHLPLSAVTALIAGHVDGRTLGIFGEPGVNVLELNLALDRESDR
ncbi:MAG TPA: potassium-transporting ATPase subunit KdpC [Solirubrobacteraceae bacterium]|jgi:K+-transporting ATPase ATPase C chain|nr:potassium-transporting ATPase subunit KdpC [Solirubrobacteraceae bacterium]